ncbi:MAG TPA: FAD-dependent monooxygenase [Acidobacteriaceae bacterium]|nr:FAD-dependent monooxygenase [Acidobacteriaceae bacterium]
MSRQPQKTEAVILGGGPAGLAAAIALRQRGIDCVVIEALPPIIDKGCGEGLMPDALAVLRDLGVEIPQEDGHPFRGIRFLDAQHQVDASFPGGQGLGVRRTSLHRLIAARAQAAGVDVLWESRVQQINRGSLVVNQAKIDFRWLIGADGQASGVRRWAGLSEVREETLRFGFRTHYKIAPWSEYVEVHWGAAGQMYITPVAPECVCAAFLSKDPKFDRATVLDGFPEIARRLKSAPVISRVRGAVSATRRLRRVQHDSVALIGDASGSADAITGEGLATSFRQAVALASAIEKKDLRHYGRAHQEIGRLPHAMGKLMLTMDRWPALERRALQALSSEPGFFRHLLSVHVGKESFGRFVLRQGPRFGWSLLAAEL